MKKFVFMVLSIAIMSCSKESSVDTLASINSANTTITNLNAYSNASTYKLGVAIGGTWEKIPVNVKMIRFDYQSGHTPLVPVDSFTYRLNGTSINMWYDKTFTMFPYRGMMRVIVTADSVGVQPYTKDVLLTDSTGWIINLDTSTIAKPGNVGMRNISDVVPKSFH